MPMIPEEKERYDRIDRQLEFLAAHQAQLSSDIAVLYQTTARLAETSAKHDEQIARHGDQIAQMGVNVQSLADSVLRLARVVDERDRQTSEKLNTLIAVGERYFSNGKHE